MIIMRLSLTIDQDLFFTTDHNNRKRCSLFLPEALIFEENQQKTISYWKTQG